MFAGKDKASVLVLKNYSPLKESFKSRNIYHNSLTFMILKGLNAMKDRILCRSFHVVQAIFM